MRTSAAKKRSNRTSYLVRAPYPLFDLGVIAALGPEVVATHLALRTFVWRGKRGGEALRFYEGGQLPAKVTQTKLGRLFRVNRQTVVRHVHKLVALGWVKRLASTKSGCWIYDLGLWTTSVTYRRTLAASSCHAGASGNPSCQKVMDRDAIFRLDRSGSGVRI